MSWVNCILVVLLGFGLEVIDASFGMGYGTILTPVLLMMGYDALQVVPAVIASQLVGDFLAVFFHHRFKNVNMAVGSHDFKVGSTLAAFSLIGSIVAVLFALNISKFALNLYIGVLVLVIGLVVLATTNKPRDFSWVRLMFLGSIAAFNKGLSGGGYGPLVAAGQIITGVEARAAIGITSLAEGVTCIAAILTYIVFGKQVDWLLALWLSIGVALSTPVAAYIVHRLDNKKLRLIIGAGTLILGTITIFKTVRTL